MIEINLAPGAERARATRSLRLPLSLPKLPSLQADPRVVVLGFVALLGVFAVGFGFWRQGVVRDELGARIAQEVTDSTRFATTIALVQTLQARQDTIRQQIGVIREVDQRRYVWPHLLDEISRAVPEFTWLTQIGAKEEPLPVAAPADSAARPAAPVGPSFTLQGQAGSTPALTRFMKNLEASPFIRDVTLVTSEQVGENGRTLHRFTLEARYEVPDSSVIVTVPIVPVD